MMNEDMLMALYRHMRTARKLDEMEAALARRGEVPFYVSGSGHEAAVGLYPHLIAADYLHCHYRDKALALARGVPPEEFLHMLFGNAASHSGGRRMPGFTSDRELRILSAPTVVGNNAMQAVGVAAAVKEHPEQPLAVCCIGDGGTQEGEFLEAVAEAARSCLPVLFFVQDNRYALSTPTGGRTFYDLPDGTAPDDFHGVPIRRCDGARLESVFETMGEAVADIRRTRAPRIVVMRTERLTSHTNSDDHRMYRSAEEIERINRECDPVRELAARLRDAGHGAELDALDQTLDARLADIAARARGVGDPAPEWTVKRPLDDALMAPEREYTGSAEAAELTLLEAMRETLRRRLADDPAVSLYGQDIEDPKGDVFGLTRGLGRQFPGRVRNAPLSESTIAGVSIGRALAGERPIAFMQFADFLPLALNQLICELGTLYWRTRGQWEAPVMIMAVCGAYRPGLGPYHAQTPAAVLAQIPGIDVFVPSTAGDAAGLLNASLASGRPAVFLYPKTLINDRTRMTSADVERHFVPIGRARRVRPGDALTLVSWGSTMPLCERTADVLAGEGVHCDVLDLRTVSPWDAETVLESARRTGRLLVVDEDGRSCGLAGEICAHVAEHAGMPVNIKRVTREDTYIPYNYINQLAVLPSLKRILETAADMVGYDVRWEQPVSREAGKVIVKAIGSSPSDETVRITQLHVKEGDAVEAGSPIASAEADKAAMEISSPVTGSVEKLHLAEGDTAPVGTPLAVLVSEETAITYPPVTEIHGVPMLEKQREKSAVPRRTAGARVSGRPVYLNSICSAQGSRRMTNKDFLDAFPDWSEEDVLKRTGIEERSWLAEGENVLTLAVKASRQLLDQEKLEVSDLDMIICSTGTPISSMTPSLACRVLKELAPEGREVMVQAYDVNAACTGFLYSLQAAYDTLKYDSTRKIMVITAETLSPVIDKTDPGTAFIFADAATASLLSCEKRKGNMHALVHRPVLSAMGVDEHILRVPFQNSGEFVHMEGQQVFRVAVRKMVDMLDAACAAENVTVDELDMIVPHQANERIIEAARKMIKFPKEKVFNQMRHFGNTSSNTIPLALQVVIRQMQSGQKVGLSAFGGGYTFGGAVLEIL